MTAEKIQSEISPQASCIVNEHKEDCVLRESPEQHVHTLIIGVWFGLLTGLLEVFALSMLRLFKDKMIFVSKDFLWMAPLLYVFLFITLGLVLSFVARLWPRLASVRVVTFVFTFIGFLSLLLMPTWLHKLAALLLAAGLAMQISRFIARHPRGFYSLIESTMGWTEIFNKLFKMNKSKASSNNTTDSHFQLSRRQFVLGASTVIAGVAVGVRGWEKLAERSVLASLPSELSNKPNVLLIVLDTVRAQSLSVSGYNRNTTPQLERLAKESTRFERAIATAPWTLTSHASMFTGHYPHELSADWWTPLDATYPTLAEVLGAYGYLTAGFVANTINCSYETGLNRGFAHYEDYKVSIEQVIMNSSLGRAIGNNERLRKAFWHYQFLGRKTAPEVNKGFLSWLSNRDKQRPFFAFLNYFDAHNPYLPPESFDIMFGENKKWRNPLFSLDQQWSALEIQAELDAYEACIACVDHYVGKLFDELQQRGVLENTLVIITSDHGEEFGEHRVMQHGTSLYLPSLLVPLLIRFPSRVPPDLSVHEPVSLRNLPATVIDLIGLEDRIQFPGHSLSHYWGATRAPDGGQADSVLSEISFLANLPKWAPVSKGPMKSLVIDQYHYIRNGDRSEEIYDFEIDPWEIHNLSSSKQYFEKLKLFRASLERLLRSG